MQIREVFLAELSALVGEECWGVTGGEGTGSVISLSIGQRRPRPKPLNNPHLTELVRHCKGTYSLMLYCPWRIESRLQVLSGSHMSNLNDGPMVRGYGSICGQKIKTVACSGPAFDLRLDFENERSLVIHCSAIGMEQDECYTFGTPSGWFRVGLDGRLTLKECDV
jgi:hypothetical protein